MKRQYVLVLTQPHDDSVPPVSDWIERLGCVPVVWDTYDFPQRALVASYCSPGYPLGWTGGLITKDAKNDATIPLGEIRSIWYRRPRQFDLPSNLSEAQREFAMREAKTGIGGVLRALNCLWVNHPEATTTADYKPYQLFIAEQCGLNVPDSLITNDEVAAREFVDKHDANVIYKTLSGGYLPANGREEAGGAIYTSTLTSDSIDQLDLTKHTACLFQEKIPKDIEVRVTVIGSQVYSVGIDSQGSDATETDWRRSYPDLKYQEHSLPITIREAICELVHRLGLVFAAIDLIVTPANEYVFLEVNPLGQWLWLEYETGLPLSESIARLLVSGPGSPGTRENDPKISVHGTTE